MAVVATGVRRRGRNTPRTQARRSSSGALFVYVLFTMGLGAFTFLPEAQSNPRLYWSIAGTTAALTVGFALLWLRARRRPLRFEISLRAQHYLQASMQGAVYVYWGWYWPPVYAAIPLIAAQLVFAYGFDMLLAWMRRDTYTLGFGPFPVIFSTNLFLWFKPDWFYLQFCMIAVGFAAKELIRWDKGGRPSHIFNPSSFPLAIFSIGLILTGTTSWTLGQEIARTQFNPPYIYVLLFLVGLPGQFLFGVTTMTMSAVVTTYLFGLAYFGATGTYFFVDSYIPVAVFLGMHLLFTDPSTSPRTELGRIVFGMLYGLGNILLYALLRDAGIPAFYDKLLPVPILNLSIKLIDRAATSSWLSWIDPARLGASLAPRRRNLAYMTLWTAAFITLSSVDGVGDHHPGHRVQFWQQACLQNAANACANVSVILDTYCRDGSGWACNEAGALRWSRRVASDGFLDDFTRSCSQGFRAGCQNAAVLAQDATQKPVQLAPTVQDYPVILRTGKGPIPETSPIDLLTRACDEKWGSACHSLGIMFLQGGDVPRQPERASAALEKGCTAGIAPACSDLGLMLYSADGVPADKPKGLEHLKRACDLGLQAACQWYKQATAKKD